MGLAKKIEPLMALRPDIAVIQECGDPSQKSHSRLPCADHQWVGLHRNKGLGVFAFGEYGLIRHGAFSERFHLFLPLVVQGPLSFNLMAVWAYNHRVAPESGACGVPSEACEFYAEFLSSKKETLVVGDFNNNFIWDKRDNPANHSRTVDALARAGLRSAYHVWFGEDFGKETQGTFYFYGHITKPYHIDYAFLQKDSFNALSVVELGRPEDWLQYSDHVPLVLELSSRN